MEILQIQVLEIATRNEKGESKNNSLLKTDLSYLNHSSERDCVKEDEFYTAIERLKYQQENVLKTLREMQPNRKIEIDCQINLRLY